MLEHGDQVWGKLGCGSRPHPLPGELPKFGVAQTWVGMGLAEATCLPISRYFLSFLVHPNINQASKCPEESQLPSIDPHHPQKVMRAETGMGTLCPMHSNPFLTTGPPGLLLTCQGIWGAPRPGPLPRLHDIQRRLTGDEGGGGTRKLRAQPEQLGGHTGRQAPLGKALVSSLPSGLHLSSFNLLILGRLYLHPGYTLKTNPQVSQPSNIS